MQNIELLMTALEYIERHLHDDIKTEDVAAICFCSKDISELYDLFQERRDCYFVLCDIKHMIAINEISKKAGDLAILEQMRRMTAAAGEEDITFRIGGDEFCILTSSNSAAYAEQLADQIRSRNDRTFTFEQQEIPLFLHVTTTSLSECHRYEEVFNRLHNALRECKN